MDDQAFFAFPNTITGLSGLTGHKQAGRNLGKADNVACQA
jgi:hypothetical protein